MPLRKLDSEKQESVPKLFRKVGENLYRHKSSGTYYGLVKRAGKQFRRSLKTSDRRLAERRLAELKQKIGNLVLNENAGASFNKIAKRWMEATMHTLKVSSVNRRESCIKSLSPYFKGVIFRNISAQHCERWLKERGSLLAPQTFAHELGAMNGVFNYGIQKGLLLTNPAQEIKRKKIVPARIDVPTRDQFEKLVAAIRYSDGRADSQNKAAAGADLVEILAFSGCRIAEATSLCWKDVSLEHGRITVTGGETGTKNLETRTIPMTAALRQLLENIYKKRNPKPDDFISSINSAKKCLQTACRKLGFPRFTHHDFRHFFATTCIEAGVDIPTVSKWLGHKDGGALAMKVYGHLRQEHSQAMIRLVSFGLSPAAEGNKAQSKLPAPEPPQ